MRYRLTINYGDRIDTIDAIGDRNRLMDAAYEDGALGVTAIVVQK